MKLLIDIKRKKVIVIHIFIFIFFITAVIWNASYKINDWEGVINDNGDLAMGYSLLKYGMFSSGTDKHDREPTMYREPGYPAFLALLMALNPKIRKSESYDKFINDSDSIKQLKYSQIIMLVAVAFCTMYFVSVITGNIYFGYIALFMTGLSMSLSMLVNTFHVELGQSLLVLCVSLFLYKLFKKKRLIYFIFLGISLSCLVLTRAIFIYFIVFVLLILFYGVYKNIFENKKQFIIGLFSFLIICTFISGGWILRNYIYFKNPTITTRSGMVLLVRAKKNMLNVKEYFGAFWYWTLNGALAKSSNLEQSLQQKGVIVERLDQIKELFINLSYAKQSFQKGGIFERINRDNDSSYYKTAENEWEMLITKKYSGYPNSILLADAECKKIAINEILAHPVRHLLTTLPFMWRGIFVEHIYRTKTPFYIEIFNILLLGISILYFPVLFYFAFISLKEKTYDLFVFSIPALYLFGIQSFFTHNLPRYNMPLIPILVATFLISMHRIARNRHAKQYGKI